MKCFSSGVFYVSGKRELFFEIFVLLYAVLVNLIEIMERNNGTDDENTFLVDDELHSDTDTEISSNYLDYSSDDSCMKNLAILETDDKDVDNLHTLSTQKDKSSNLNETQNEISSLLWKDTQRVVEYEADFEAPENYRKSYLELVSSWRVFRGIMLRN
ncbi:uncharacterized protein NPIL_525621 [Nephila pilipes]|uniref:Uncharacterized protein n=1 Tax=Nephila pilipes TaxID=299642 RepID=A0A8X6P571_NEPPI|nr:uncharacterized protein NPIL_133311 [Nephila pilipes]GFT51027.1 uncharacterized protein NPIL_525621 [Nephila pilipes]